MLYSVKQTLGMFSSHDSHNSFFLQFVPLLSVYLGFELVLGFVTTWFHSWFSCKTNDRVVFGIVVNDFFLLITVV